MKLPRCLKYIDRASMKNSIEARVPFLDHELVELNFQAPNKNTIADPQTHWLKNNLKDCFYDIVINNSKSSNLFNKKEIEKYYNYFCNEKKHINSFFLLQIFLTELWFQKILKN